MRRLSVAGAPPIIPRLSWGANEAIRRHPPHYAPAVTFAVVHHTAGSNNYSPDQSAAIVRGIELYHVKGNGWDDIGYNFLVDKYGQVFEGRYGGIDRPVVGAHALGFNRGSVGVSVLGNYDSRPLSAEAKTALEQLLAWRLDVAHVEPLSTLTWPSLGNARFPKGIPVFLRAISGHRDTGFTDCPGNTLYAEIPQIAHDVEALGLPKVYAPVASGDAEGLVHITARLSSVLPWTVTVVNSAGITVAQGTGTGSRVDWTWDATRAPADRYTWTIATPGARSATGTTGGPAAPLAAQSGAAPAVLSPGGDPSDDTTTITYTLAAAATVTTTLLDANGQTVTTLFNEPKPAGVQTFSFSAHSVPNGVYTIQVVGVGADGKASTTLIPLTINNSIDALTLTPALFSPARKGSVQVAFSLLRGPMNVALNVFHGKELVAAPSTGTYQAGRQTIVWDGHLSDGATARDGTYTLALSAGDGTTSFTRTLAVTLDSTPPKISILSARNLLFGVSEPATATLVVGARRYTRTLKKAGTVQFRLAARPKAFQLFASDVLGNTSSIRYPHR
jgi:flagellar hook assembly protein FlgD